MTFARRSANVRGRAVAFGFLVLADGLGFFAGRTSTCVPSGRALGSSKTTLPFFILPRTAMTNLRGFIVRCRILIEVAAFEQHEHLPQPFGPSAGDVWRTVIA